MLQLMKLFPNWFPAIAVSIVAYLVYKNIQDAKENFTDVLTGSTTIERKVNTESIGDAIDNQKRLFVAIKSEKATNPPLYNSAAHLSKANTIYEALNTYNPSWSPFQDKFATCKQALLNCRASDLRQVYAHFGLRTNTNFGFQNFTGDLIQWLQNEFEDRELDYFKSLFRLTRLW